MAIPESRAGAAVGGGVVKFTKTAQAMLDSIPDQDRIAEIGNHAKQIARIKGHSKVWASDVLGATLLAGPEFLPDPPTGQDR